MLQIALNKPISDATQTKGEHEFSDDEIRMSAAKEDGSNGHT
jgi:hypothetical protein